MYFPHGIVCFGGSKKLEEWKEKGLLVELTLIEDVMRGLMFDFSSFFESRGNVPSCRKWMKGSIQLESSSICRTKTGFLVLGFFKTSKRDF